MIDLKLIAMPHDDATCRLVRHPAPHMTESLPGYALRLTDANGYPSPRSLFRLAGMKSGETPAGSFSCAKLARIACQSTADLQRISFQDPEDGPYSLRLLGHRVSTSDLNLSGARVCPACIAEKGFVEAHWHVDLMWACPVHARSPVWFCGSCKRRVGWMRPALLTCQCGAKLLESPRETFSEAELWLLDDVRRKVLSDDSSRESGGTMPSTQIAGLGLSQTLSILRFLGTSRLIANRSRKSQIGRALVKAAAQVLQEWPRNFQKLLNDLSSEAGPETELPDDLTNVFDLVNRRMSVRMTRLTSDGRDTWQHR